MSLEAEGSGTAKWPVRFKLIIIVAVVMIVVLSTTSVLLYRQEQDYYGAKYRSQNVIVFELSTSVAWTGEYLVDMSNTSKSMNERAIASTSAVDELRHISRLTWALREMYLHDTEKNATFTLLDRATQAITGHVWLIHEFLIWNVTNGLAMLEQPDVAQNLTAVGPLMAGLSVMFDAGFKDAVDFEKHPYSVVNGLDLASIREQCQRILAVFG